MLDLWNQASLTLFDSLLGWLLDFPRELAVVCVAFLTALVMTAVRWLATDQNRLRRAAEDLRRLKQLGREARRRGDTVTVERCKAVKARIGLIKLRAEGKPLVWVLLPLALLATWAFYRLEHHPPQSGETIEVAAYLPESADGEVIHLVPQPGLTSVNGWVQPLALSAPPPSRWDRFVAWLTRQEVALARPDALAVWRLQGEAKVYTLVLRYKGRTLERELRVGYRSYAPVWDVREGEPIITEIRQREVRFFGLPGLGAWLPAWLVGYVVLTIVFTWLIKRVLAVY